MKPYLPQNWNDVLALCLIVGIPTIWLLRSDLDGEVNGVLIAVFTLVAQYYYRRSPPK